MDEGGQGLLILGSSMIIEAFSWPGYNVRVSRNLLAIDDDLGMLLEISLHM